jgi:hypothetical protein
MKSSRPGRYCFRVDAIVCADAHAAPARDDQKKRRLPPGGRIICRVNGERWRGRTATTAQSRFRVALRISTTPGTSLQSAWSTMPRRYAVGSRQHRRVGRCLARAPSSSYSEVTGITQTARNFGASLGLAVLGAILVSRDETNVTGALTKAGVPRNVAHQVAGSLGSGAARSGSGGSRPPALVHDVQLAFAHSTQTVFYIMAGVMAATFILAVRGLPRGRVELAEEPSADMIPASASVADAD